MIFVDSNIPMYLVGGPHPNKPRARELLEEYFDANERLVTDVEVLQEILHRYTSIDRRDAIQPAFEVVEGIVDEIFPLDAEDLERAKHIALTANLSARDSLHLAVMRFHRVDRILTFDSDFDEVSGISRLY
ncbi:MAG: type II toxin-antitoxin system VapC family toxin [Rhodothermales bacterium]|nr:type II toxin-antitoxin system VapC family toxin [Rhodothermales bacterium]